MAPPRKIYDNPLRTRPPIKKPPPIPRQQAARARMQKRGCCDSPDVVDGTCHNCGRIVDDSNIVSEIMFGESSSGAAVVQGQFLSADQGAARSMGPAFARAGGGESREATQKDGKMRINGLATLFRIAQNTSNIAIQTFKMAVTMNFVQGRRLEMVAAACLYTACRKDDAGCPYMLIDFADKIGVNVFKLGRVFKALHKSIPGSGEGLNQILPEDLIWRFTSRLEFGELNDKVAEDAIRMCRRMTKDWMTQGRRPGGLVGACIILAARMNNFRRTVTEVVYVVKVTVQTIQKRLEEFKHTDSSQMTVGDFLSSEFIEKAHDPPSFYKAQPEYQAKQKKRKRRNMGNDGYTSEGDEEAEEVGESNKRQKSNPSVPLRKDADGFAIPPLPTPAPTAEIPIDPEITAAEITEEQIEKETGASFTQLVREFGDQISTAEAEDAMETDTETTPSSPKRGRGRPKTLEVHVSPEWESSELEMEGEISELISDPHTQEHAASYAMARKRAAAHVLVEAIENPGRNVSMDTLVGEDEFANDPEVLYCLLSPEDVVKKEKVWVNENKIWLRQQQAKQWEARQAENRPPKPKRNRKPKPQMGTGQKGPANSPAEAAISVLKERAFSKKINYNSMNDIFSGIGSLKNKRLGSAATSRASSEYADSETGSRAGSETSSVVDSATGFLIPNKPRKKTVPKSALTSLTGGITTPNSQEEEDEEGDDDDYVTAPVEMSVEEQARRMRIEEDDPVENWKEGMGGEDGAEGEGEMEEEFDDPGMGDMDDEGAFGEREYGEDEGGFDDEGF